MTPFLKEIALNFLKNDLYELKDYCFIFPNRRSGTFFRKYLIENSEEKAFLLPHITTISDFVSEVAELTEASRLELIIYLYDEYKKKCEERNIEVSDFDKFVFWGDIIINDFNDIDKYMADPNRVFANVKDIKEINANYLTEEQKEVLKLFGFKVKEGETEDFWSHCSETEQKFVSLWEILNPLYHSLSERLIREEKSYSGKLYRLAAEKLRITGADDLKYKKYIFVGFNVLSESEKRIFGALKNKGIGDYYWDLNSPYFDNSNKGALFLRKYEQEFKSKYIVDRNSTNIPNVEVISVPSNIGQVQYLPSIIDALIEKGETDKKNAINTAIVLPDEELFLPTLSSIMSTVEKVNITMGFPMKFSSIAMLISSLSILHNRAQKESEGYTFFHEEVKNILLHPFVKAIDPKGIKNILKDIINKKLFRIQSSEFSNYPKLASIFSPLEDLNDRNCIYKYFLNVIKIVETVLDKDNNIEQGFILQYKNSLNQIMTTLEAHNVELRGKTFFFLIERMLASATISFEGEPLLGLQIMGILETRNLDFDNVILLSMNERIFPKKNFIKSFIPNSLRRVYELSTLEHQESIYTYYFYRLISRANNAFLLYDSRTQGVSSGEPSRYIYQLQYLYNKKNIRLKSLSYDIVAPNEIEIKVPKDANIMEHLQKFKEDGSGEYLSASVINKYINCPLSFYFEKIEKIKLEDELTEFIDSATFGTIVHDTMRDIYITPGVYDTNSLDSKKIRLTIDNAITKYINKYYLKKGDEALKTPVSGEALLISNIVKYYIEAILEYDTYYAQNGKLEILQCEKEEKKYWPELGINFKQFIDRIDQVTDTDGVTTMRIIDYKTGDEKTKIKNLEELFDNKVKSRAKGILQLLIYCNFHCFCEGKEKPIKPLIYKIRDIKNAKEQFNLKIDDLIIENYQDYNEQFMEFLKQKINELFDPSIPFTQTDDPNNCNFCNFKMICQR